MATVLVKSHELRISHYYETTSITIAAIANGRHMFPAAFFDRLSLHYLWARKVSVGSDTLWES